MIAVSPAAEPRRPFEYLQSSGEPEPAWNRSPSESAVTLRRACPGFQGARSERDCAPCVISIGFRADDVLMSEAVVEQRDLRRAFQLPRPLDLPDPGQSFSDEQMRRKLKVLFLVSQPTSSPAISVHAALMRSFDPRRVEVHVAYNALADSEPYRSDGTSVRSVFPAAPNVTLPPTQFGPVAAGPKGRLVRSALRSLLPGIRDCIALVRYIRRNEIDVIHCEKGPRNGFYAYVLARLTSARYAMH